MILRTRRLLMRRVALALSIALSLVLSLAVTLGLGGCAAQAGQAPTVVASPTSTANLANGGTPDGAVPPTPAIAPTATFVVIPGTPGAYRPACQATQLALKFAIDEAATGTSSEMGTVTNRSSSACSLFGFPGAQLLDAQSHPMTIQVFRATSGVWSGVFPEQHIQVAPGASAYFAVAWSATPVGAQTSCLTVGYFALTPPDSANALIAPDAIHVCGPVTISPFQVAPFMGS